MNSFSLKRPLYIFGLVLFLTVAFLVGFNEQYGLLTAAVGGTGMLITLAVSKLRTITILTVCSLAVLAASVLVYTRYIMIVQQLAMFENTEATVTVRITQLPKNNSKLYRAEVVDGEHVPVGTKLCVSFANTETVAAQYDTVSGEALFYLPHAEQQYLYADDVYLMAYFKEETQIETGSPTWYEAVVNDLREQMLSGVLAFSDGDAGNLIAGVCFGEIERLDESVQSDFRKSGLTHILVVSGLHMTLLTAALYAVLQRCRLNRFVTLGITLLCLWLFTLMVGFSCSVMRASVMLHFLLIGQTVRCRADSRTSLITALLLILLQNPYAVLDVGFLLSFFATLGLVIWTPLFNRACARVSLLRKHPILSLPIKSLVTSLAAGMFTMPILAVFFGTIPVLSPLSNLLAVMPTTLLLYCGMIGSLLYGIPFLTPVANICFMLGSWLANWVMWVAKTIAALPFSQLFIRHGSILLLLIAIPLAVYAGYKLLGRKGGLRVLLGGVAVLVVSVSVLTVFSKTAAFVRVSEDTEGTVVLVEDGGYTVAVVSASDYYGFICTKRFLSSCGVYRLDTLIVTESNTEMTAGLAKLLETVTVETVVCPKGDINIAAGLPDVEQKEMEERDSLRLCDDTIVEKQDEWWRLRMGGTCVLLASATGSVDRLPQGWRQAHLVIFKEELPASAEKLGMQHAVFIGDPQSAEGVTAALPWGSARVWLTARNGDATYCTFGRGDMMTAEHYFL